MDNNTRLLTKSELCFNCVLLLLVFTFCLPEIIYGYSDNDIRIKLDNGRRSEESRDYSVAIHEYLAAVDISRKLNGEYHVATAISLGRLGMAYYSNQNYDNALKSLSEALNISLKIFGDGHELTAICLTGLGSTCLTKGNYDQSIDFFQKALIIQSKLKNHRATAIINNNLGEGHRYKGENDKALDYYKESLRMNLKYLAKDDPELATNYHNIGLILYEKGQYDQALKYSEEAYKIWVKAFGENHPITANVYDSMGFIYAKKSNFTKSLRYFDRALNVRIKTLSESHVDVAKSYLNIGETYRHAGNSDKAVFFQEKALAIILKVLGGDHVLAGTCYSGIGWAYLDKDEYDRAIGYFENAISIWSKSLGEVNHYVAIAYNNIGLAFLRKGDPDRAIIYFNKALNINQNILGDNHQDTITNYSNLALAYTEKNDPGNALTTYKILENIHRKVSDKTHPNTATIFNNIGLFYLKLGEYKKALDFFDEALELNIKNMGERHTSVALVYNNIGFAYDLMLNSDKAIQHYKKASEIYRNSDDRQNRILTATNLGLSFYDKGDLQKARAYFGEAIEVIEQGRREMGGGKQEFISKNIHSYLYSLKISALTQDHAAFFEAAERKKARSFLDRLSIQSILSVKEIEKNDREQVLKLNNDIMSLSTERDNEIKKAERAQDREKLSKLAKDIETKEQTFRLLDAQLMKNERYRSLRKVSSINLKKVQRMVGKNTAILEYIVWEEDGSNHRAKRDNQSYCLIITHNKTFLVELDRQFDYAQMISNYRECISSQSKTMEYYSNILYKKLIAPLEKYILDCEKLIIVPDGTLAFVPFDALRERESASYLCEKFIISLTPSASVMAMIKDRIHDERTKTLLACGGAIYSDHTGTNRGAGAAVSERGISIREKEQLVKKTITNGSKVYYTGAGLKWENIPGTLDEVETIGTKIFSQKDSTIIKGLDASESNIKLLSNTNKLNQYRIVHFATHGYYDQNYPSFSAVVLSEVSGKLERSSIEDGYLSLEESATLDLKADFVNLSACETGLGKIVNGEGVIGLTRAFQVAGANRVGVTLWQVADNATKDFMVGFYRRVKSGKSFSVAMSEMKRDFIKTKFYSDPYYWSPFVLYGD